MEEQKKYEAQSLSLRASLSESRDLDTLADAVRSEPKIPDSSGDANYEQLSFANVEVAGSGEILTAGIPLAQSFKKVYSHERQIFLEMRKLAGGRLASPAHRNLVFYRQARFMEHFEDHYDTQHPYSEYYPTYQYMSDKQLRTYFSWRTAVRASVYKPIDFSYIALYMYELLALVGVDGPEEALEKLLELRAQLGSSIDILDQYLLPWLKDLHICYPLEGSFSDFIQKHELEAFYPTVACFDSRASIRLAALNQFSDYKLLDSRFYKDHETLVNEHFDHLWKKMTEHLKLKGADLYDFIFYPVVEDILWIPFRTANFYPELDKRERFVRISEREQYRLKVNEWTHSPVVLTEEGRMILSAIFRELELQLREQTKYRYKLKGGNRYASYAVRSRLKESGIELTHFVQKSVLEYEQLKHRTVISVSKHNLYRIRDEAAMIQDRLTLDEDKVEVNKRAVEGVNQFIDSAEPDEGLVSSDVNPQKPVASEPNEELNAREDFSLFPSREADGLSVWDRFASALTVDERKGLEMLIQGEPLREYLRSLATMPEVYIDQINEKAIDIVGDAILESGDTVYIYEDYLGEVKQCLEG